MRIRQRRRDEDQDQSGGWLNGGGAGDLAAMRRARRDFLAAADEAINKALSKGSSELLLAANRHQGGR